MCVCASNLPSCQQVIQDHCWFITMKFGAEVRWSAQSHELTKPESGGGEETCEVCDTD